MTAFSRISGKQGNKPCEVYRHFPNFYNGNYIPFHLTLLPQFHEIPVRRFTFWEIKQFLDFLETSGNSCTSCLRFKISEFLVECRGPIATILNCILDFRGENLNYKSVAKVISKPPFLAPEVRWASKFTMFVRFMFLLNVSNYAHIWYVM